MQTLARSAALAASAWLVVGCAGAPARPASPEPVVVVGDGVKPQAKKDKPDAKKSIGPAEARKKALEEAAEYGMLGLLQGSPDSSVFGKLDESALGGLMGVEGGGIGGFGAGGLGLSGVGQGGGGGGSIGVAGFGTRGTGLGGGGGGGGIGYGTIGIGKAGYGRGYGSGSRRPGERVKAKVETATVTGPLTPEVVQRILTDHRDDVQDCYVLESRNNTRVRGRMTLAFTINGAGRVDEVSVPESTFWSRDLTDCVAQVVGTFRFPALPQGTGEVKVILPIQF